MKHEKSCGAVVFTREGGTVRYVIAESIRHFFGFPKGHVETGESESVFCLVSKAVRGPYRKLPSGSFISIKSSYGIRQRQNKSTYGE